MYIYIYLLRMTTENSGFSSWGILFIYPSVAIEPSVGPWPLSEFCKPMHRQ
jgi:hypothetical protein